MPVEGQRDKGKLSEMRTWTCSFIRLDFFFLLLFFTAVGTNRDYYQVEREIDNLKIWFVEFDIKLNAEPNALF